MDGSCLESAYVLFIQLLCITYNQRTSIISPRCTICGRNNYTISKIIKFQSTHHFNFDLNKFFNNIFFLHKITYVWKKIYLCNTYAKLKLLFTLQEGPRLTIFRITYAKQMLNICYHGSRHWAPFISVCCQSHNLHPKS